MRTSGTRGETAGRLGFALFPVVIAVGAVLLALGFESRLARQLPLVAGIPLVGLSIANFVVEWRTCAEPADHAEPDIAAASAPTRSADLVNAPDVEQPTDATPPTPEQSGVSLPVAMASIALFVAVYLVFGQFISIPIGIIVLLRISGQSWLAAVLTSAITWAVIYMVATRLHVQTHDGWIDLGRLVLGYLHA